LALASQLREETRRSLRRRSGGRFGSERLAAAQQGGVHGSACGRGCPAALA
jgi:hypothetical protein